MKKRVALLSPLCACGLAVPALAADERDTGGPVRAEFQQAEPDEAWWTGPIATSSADTLPRGHFLIEPYLYDVRTSGGDYAGSLTYILYGLTDRLTMGAIPTFGSGRSRGSASTRRVAVNDLTLQAQLRLHRARPGDAIPTLAVLVQRGVSLGRFDRLGEDPDRGIGGGVAATTLGINAQRVDRLPSGRALRTRINVARSLPATAHVRGTSVFGTPPGFEGKTRTGASTTANISFEYSVTRRVALATDLIARWTRPGQVAGQVEVAGNHTEFTSRLPAGSSFSVAPAIEYSWSSSRGILVGVRWTAPRHGQGGSMTPVIAFNAVI